MSENIKNQFNESTLNNPVFHIADGRQGPNKLLTTASAAVPASFLGRKKELTDLQRQRHDLHDLLGALALLPAENHPPTLLGVLLAPDDKPGLKRQLDQLAQKGWEE